MYELPEIETLRRDLEREIAGRKIKSVEINSLKSIPGHRTKKPVTDLLEGAKVVVVERHGLDLVVHLDNDNVLVFRLGENSRLQRCTSKTKTDSDTEMVVTFTQGGDLRFADTGGSGEVHVVPAEELIDLVGTPEQRGLDLLARPVSWVDFGRLLMKRDEPLKRLSTDPDVFVGIGPIYSDEILFDAGLRYDRPASELSMQELRRLNRSVAGILFDAVKYRGTDLEERPFIDLSGKPGEYGEHLAVYGRAGELSPRSWTPIKKAQFEGRTVYYCSTQV